MIEHREIREYGHSKGIFNVCQDLHMTNTGSYEDMTKEDYDKGLAFLKWKFANWDDSLPSTRDWDFAVRFLIKETIVECETFKYRYK